jgi:hypothetical protein
MEQTNWLELGVFWSDENGQARPINLRTAQAHQEAEPDVPVAVRGTAV